jgi:hypothetical protein
LGGLGFWSTCPESAPLPSLLLVSFTIPDLTISDHKFDTKS